MKKDIPNYIRKQRNDWNGLCPITKVIPNKKKNQKIKHKNKFKEDNSDA